MQDHEQNSPPLPQPHLSSFRRLYHAIGTVVLEWSFLEDMIDVFIVEIYNHWGANEIDSELPRTSFDKKIRLIDKWLDQDLINRASRDILKERVPDLRRMKLFRDDLIHGVVRHVTDYPNKRVLEFHRRHPKNREMVRVTTTNVELIVKFRKDVTHFSEGFGACTIALVEARNQVE